MNETQKAINARFACKIFDKDKKIPQEKLRDIIDAGRLAPSSFGLEHWKFLIVQNDDLKKKLEPACFNQEQITTCSDLVVILGRNDIKDGSSYFEQCLNRFGSNKDVMQKVIAGFLSRLDDEKYASWVLRQCYIAGTQMMIAGSSLGVDSCPMEGFNPKKVKEILGLNDDVFVSLLIPFGYRTEDPKREKMRWDFKDIASFV